MQNNNQIDLLCSELSKSNIEVLSDNLIKPFEDGFQDALEMDIRLKFIEETVKKAREKMNPFVLKKTIEKGSELFGAKIAFKSGYAKLDYEQDETYRNLLKALKEREELLNMASKTTHNFVTDDGEVIPKVGIKSYTKDSVSYTFKR